MPTLRWLAIVTSPGADLNYRTFPFPLDLAGIPPPPRWEGLSLREHLEPESWRTRVAAWTRGAREPRAAFSELLKLPNARDRVVSQLDKKPG